MRTPQVWLRINRNVCWKSVHFSFVTGGNPPSPSRSASGGGDLRHWCQWHCQRVGQRQGHRQGAAEWVVWWHPHHLFSVCCQGGQLWWSRFWERLWQALYPQCCHAMMLHIFRHHNSYWWNFYLLSMAHRQILHALLAWRTCVCTCVLEIASAKVISFVTLCPYYATRERERERHVVWNNWRGSTVKWCETGGHFKLIVCLPHVNKEHFKDELSAD